VLIGDLNLVCFVEDKNTQNFNSALYASFNDAIQNITVLELPLLDQRYTCLNLRVEAVLVHLDRPFANCDHCQTFPSPSLYSLPRPTLDHTSIKLSMSTTIPLKMLGYITTPSLVPLLLPRVMLLYVWMCLDSLQSVSRRNGWQPRFGLGVLGHHLF